MTDRDPFGTSSWAPALSVTRNLSTRYLAIAIEAGLGVLILPFNVSHLGQAGYGLWVLTASVTAYFSVLDMGYSGAIVKFVAQYRARCDARGLNEILSTIFFVFLGCAAAMYAVAILLATYIDTVFHLSPDQVPVARMVLLIVSVNVAMTTAFSVFGGVMNGFQRYDLNNLVGTASTIVTSIANVIVLSLGFGLLPLVATMTAIRVLTLLVYRTNAYRVFPGLRISAHLASMARLREVTGFSVHMAVIDWANRLNYSIDTLVIGAFMNTAAVAVWAVAQRLAELVQRLANQLNDILFPAIVENDTAARLHRLQRIFLDGTRLSLATVFPMGAGLILLAEPLIHAWVGPGFAGSVAILQMLSFVVIVRIGNATATTVLKGAGAHRLVAVTNSIAALCNIALSIALIRPFGQVGVAIGTLVPVCVASTFVIFPRACRRVELPIRLALARSVWPAAWPTLVMWAFIAATRPLLPAQSLVALGAEFAVAMLVYAVTFVAFAMTAVERRFYVEKLAELLQFQRPRALPEAS